VAEVLVVARRPCEVLVVVVVVDGSVGATEVPAAVAARSFSAFSADALVVHDAQRRSGLGFLSCLLENSSLAFPRRNHNISAWWF
jgi:hypothetical protein